MKQEYTKITAENWEQFKGMEVEFSDNEDFKSVYTLRLEGFRPHDTMYKFESFGDDVFKYARIKNVEEVEIEIPETPFLVEKENGAKYAITTIPPCKYYRQLDDEDEVVKLYSKEELMKSLRDGFFKIVDNNTYELTDNTIQIPSNLSKAEAEEILKKASEDKVEVDRWYLVEYNVEKTTAMFLNKDKKWQRFMSNNSVCSEFDFDYCKIISPMYTQEEVDKLKEKG